MIRSYIVKNEQVVSVLPKDKKIQAFFELKKPSTYPSFLWDTRQLTIVEPQSSREYSNAKKAAGSRGKVELTQELEAEYQAVLKIMLKQIRLRPYYPTKKLRLVTDGAKTVGT